MTGFAQRATRSPRRDVRCEETGSVTLFAVLAAVGLLVIVGLVADAGAKLRAAQRADVIAEEAARAGGQAINLPAAVQGEPPTVDTSRAVAAATAYLHAAGVPGQVRAEGGTRLSVHVTIRQPTLFLSLVGIDQTTAHGKATARLVRGVTGAEEDP